MLISDKNLIGLPVYTQSGDYLGQVAGFDVEIESGEIAKYRVKNPGLMNWFKISELTISRDQVIELTQEKMVVADLAIKDVEKVERENSAAVPVKNIEPVITSKID